MTPYATPDMVKSAPLGISWSTIPAQNSDQQAKDAEVENICFRASGMVDEYCNQPLRCTLDSEILYGPDWQITVENSGVARLRPTRWPIVKVASIQCSPASAIPRNWLTVPTTAYEIAGGVQHLAGSTASGASGVGPAAILVAPGWVTWANGRRGYAVEVSYENGWPHAGITAEAAAAATTLTIDDCTGFDSGNVVAQIFDGSNTETVAVTAATAASGAGTITIPAGLTYAHDPGVVISSLPQNAIWAAMLYAAAQALAKGTTAITVPNLPGVKQDGGGGADDMIKLAEKYLHPYRRVL